MTHTTPQKGSDTKYRLISPPENRSTDTPNAPNAPKPHRDCTYSRYDPDRTSWRGRTSHRSSSTDSQDTPHAAEAGAQDKYATNADNNRSFQHYNGCRGNNSPVNYDLPKPSSHERHTDDTKRGKTGRTAPSTNYCYCSTNCYPKACAPNAMRRHRDYTCNTYDPTHTSSNAHCDCSRRDHRYICPLPGCCYHTSLTNENIKI